MLGILVALILAGLAGYAFALASAEMRRLREHWESAAAKLGLALSGPALRIDGSLRGHRVEVERSGGKAPVTTFMVHGVPQHLLIRSESIGSAFGKILAGEDLATGDERFDEKALLRSSTGRAAEACALMSESLRVAIDGFLARGGIIEHGYLLLKKQGKTERPDEITIEVELMTELARLITERARIPAQEALADLATHDPAPGVRLNALRVLLASFPASGTTTKACRIAASSDSSPATRLRAAIALGKEGLPALRRLVASDGAPAVRVEALDHLSALLPKEETLPLLEDLLASSDDEVRAHAARVLSKTSAPGLVKAIARSSRDPSLRPEWLAWHAAALASTKHPDAEPALIALLAKDSSAVRVAAAKGLAQIGTRAAVEKLLPLTQGLLLDGQVKEAASDAIAAIQSRLAGAGAGQLALSTDEEQGALSEPQTPGALTLAKKPQLIK